MKLENEILAAGVIRDLGEIAKTNPLAAVIGQRFAERTCGTCRACCTWKGVKDLPTPKPVGTPCGHLCLAGCKIYKAKPASCGDYLCGWRLGLGPFDARPDQAGVIVDLVDLSREASVASGQIQRRMGVRIQLEAAPFDPRPVLRAISDAMILGIDHVGYADPEDVDGSATRYDSDRGKILEDLKRTAITGRAPADHNLIPVHKTRKRKR